MKTKLPYVKPVVTVTIIEIEYALASGSGSVLANDDNFKMFTEWEVETEEITIDWNFPNN